MRFSKFLKEAHYDVVFNPFMTKKLLLKRMHNPSIVRKKYNFTPKEWDITLEILAACLNWKRFGGKRSAPKILKQYRKHIDSKMTSDPSILTASRSRRLAVSSPGYVEKKVRT